MDDEVRVEDDVARANGAGAQLRAAREAKGLEIAQVAAETRIPQRHLVAIEAGEYASLPSRTYAIGFARTYARLVGLDEAAVIDQVRADLAAGGPRSVAPAGLQPGDPARVPSRALAWFAVLALIIFGAGVFVFYRTYFAPGLGPAPLSEPKAVASAPANRPGVATQPAAVATGPVVFTNEMEGTWVKFYDGAGKTLFEGIMAKGDSFTVPADASQPKLQTGRPYAFAITIGGRPVAKISEKDEVVKDVPIDAGALAARPASGASPAASATVPATATPAP